jgi:hypothetical protein
VRLFACAKKQFFKFRNDRVLHWNLFLYMCMSFSNAAPTHHRRRVESYCFGNSHSTGLSLRLFRRSWTIHWAIVFRAMGRLLMLLLHPSHLVAFGMRLSANHDDHKATLTHIPKPKKELVARPLTRAMTLTRMTACQKPLICDAKRPSRIGKWHCRRKAKRTHI